MTERVNRPARETGIAWPRRRVVWSAFLVVAVGGLGTLRLVWPQSAHTVEPCRVNGVSETVRCYSVEVPESTRDPSGRKIRIRVVVLPARGPERPREPLLLIQGGPGVPGTLMARNFAQREVLRVGRELVFFDQRGTGGSQSLSCAFLRRHNFLGALFPPDHVTECRRELRRQADLAAYTNTASAEDLEAIRKANSDDPAKIREALASIKGFKGVTGESAMDENGNAVKSAVILQIIGGRQKFVKVVNP